MPNLPATNQGSLGVPTLATRWAKRQVLMVSGKAASQGFKVATLRGFDPTTWSFDPTIIAPQKNITQIDLFKYVLFIRGLPFFKTDSPWFLERCFIFTKKNGRENKMPTKTSTHTTSTYPVDRLPVRHFFFLQQLIDAGAAHQLQHLVVASGWATGIVCYKGISNGDMI